MWLFNIVTHFSIILLLLAIRQLWCRVLSAPSIDKESIADSRRTGVDDTTKVARRGIASIVGPFATSAIKKTVNACKLSMELVRNWIWMVIWKHTSLLMCMTFQHDEVWLPFMLSMISIVVLIGLVYGPRDDARGAYIPKRHRKWSRYRNIVCIKLSKQVTASALFGRIELFMYTGCRRVTRRSTLSSTVRKKIRVPAGHISKRMRSNIHVLWRWFIQKLDQSQQGASGVCEQVVRSVMTVSRFRTALIIGMILLFAGVLSLYQKEMKRKLWMIKNMVNRVVMMSGIMSNTAASFQIMVAAYEVVGNNWSAVSEATASCLNRMGIVDSCSKQQIGVTTTACVYVMACCLVLLQDCLSSDPQNGSYHSGDLAPHQDGDERETSEQYKEEDCFYDCDQFLSDVTFMTATTSSSSGRSMKGQSDLGLDSDSYWMAVDNCCTSCITNCLDDFIGPMTKVTARMKGIGGVHIVASMKGTLKWRISDDNGRVHSFLIKD
jgi:hypothetical protein